MGQYFAIYNLDKEQAIQPGRFNDGLRLREFGSSSCGVMLALATLLAGAPSPETPLKDPSGTRSWRWGQRLASSSPRAAAMWTGDLASAFDVSRLDVEEDA